MKKKCANCGRELNTTQFYKSKYSPDGYRNICRSCMLSIRNEYLRRKEEQIAEMRNPQPIAERIANAEESLVMKELKSRKWHVDKMIITMAEYEKLKKAGKVIAGPQHNDEE